MNLIKIIMNKREKKLFFVILVLLAAILFNIESIKKGGINESYFIY